MAAEYSSLFSAWGESWDAAWGPSWGGVEAVGLYPSHSPADVVAQLLLDAGITGIDSGTVSVAFERNDPDDVVTVYDTAGRPNGRVMIDGGNVEHFGITVRVRSRVHATGWRVANVIAQYLATQVQNTRTTVPAVEDIPAGAYLVHSFDQTSTILAIGADSPTSKRRAFTINGTVTLTALTTDD